VKFGAEVYTTFRDNRTYVRILLRRMTTRAEPLVEAASASATKRGAEAFRLNPSDRPLLVRRNACGELRAQSFAYSAAHTDFTSV
jgi:hypothetical protein